MLLSRVCRTPNSFSGIFSSAPVIFYGTEIRVLLWPHPGPCLVVFKPLCYEFGYMIRVTVSWWLDMQLEYFDIMFFHMIPLLWSASVSCTAKHSQHIPAAPILHSLDYVFRLSSPLLTQRLCFCSLVETHISHQNLFNSGAQNSLLVLLSEFYFDGQNSYLALTSGSLLTCIWVQQSPLIFFFQRVFAWLVFFLQ